MSRAYPEGQLRLALLEPGCAQALFAAASRLAAQQYAEEGRGLPGGMQARLRELARPDSGALLHLLLGPGGEALGYQLSNACATLGGRYAYVNETYVPLDRRGLGLGLVLMRLFVEWARAQGFTHVYSWTRSPEMRRVAEALGAKVKPVDWVSIPLC